MIVEVIFMAEEVSSKIGQEQKRYYIRQRAVPNFPLEFVEPRKHIANAGARKPRQGKTREARKIGTADNLLFAYIYCLYILYFVLYRNNQIYKKGQSQRLKWLGQHNNNRGLLKEQTGLINLQN